MNLALVWQSDERVWLSRMPSERFFSDSIVLTNKFGGGSIMVWGCFSWFGLGPLVPVIGNMNSEMYVDILDNAALPLTSAVMDAWKAIPMVTYQKLVESLPKRVQAVIQAKGGTTSY
ncbi:QLQ domain-containing protein [Trichonephila clavipes]|nr:QLQ domain-containing protein [Trichonephila clavipes]